MTKVSNGQRFGRLTTINPVIIKQRTHWNCACDCGKETTVHASNLAAGKVRSCGCLKAELDGTRNRTHGLSQTRTYKIWKGMIKRCHNPAASGYHKYGARGIAVCDRWRTSFEAFLSDMGECKPELSIDRVDNNGNYTPENCRWATTKDQAYNRRNTVLFDGRTLLEWSEISGISYGTLKRRLLKTGTIYSDTPQSIGLRKP